MALTQISTAGIKDDLITAAKIADDAVTEALLADDSVDEARLKISNAGSNGQYLQKQSGNTGGLTWATVSAGGITDVVSDTSPQLGGDLDTNSFEISLDDSHAVKFGDGNDLQIYHDGTDNIIANSGTTLAIHRATTNAGNPVLEVRSNHGATNQVKFKVDGDGDVLIPTDTGKLQFGIGSDLAIYHDGSYSYIDNTHSGGLWIRGGTSTYQIGIQAKNSENSILCTGDGSAALYYDSSKKLETTSNGVEILRGTSDTELKITAHNTTSQSRLLFADSSGIDANVSYDHNDRKLYLGTAASGGLEGDLTIDVNGHVIIPSDSGRLKIGAGEDLHIYHSGSHSYITNAGTGRLYINAEQINLHNKAVDENMLRAVQNAEVELYYDNVKRFETLSSGAKVTGDFHITNSMHIVDSEHLRIGSSNDLDLYHDGNHSFIVHDGGGHFYIKTESAGDDIVINATRDVIIQAGQSENAVVCKEDGAVELYYDASKKLSTTASGVTANGLIVDGTLNLADTKKAVFGNGSDLQIYHDGTNSIIYNQTNTLVVQADLFKVTNAADNETIINTAANGAVELYHNNVKRFETTSAGVKADNICKAWCNYDGRDNSVRNSFNISSVTDNGTGDYSFNWTAATAADFAFVGTAGEWLKSGTDRRVLSYRHGSSSNDYGDSSYLKVRTFGLNTNQTADSKVVSIAVYSE